MTRVLVTGGTGVLGRALVPRLLAKGHQVRVLSRRGPAIDDVESLRGDVTTGQGLPQAVRGVDCVIHAATSPRRGARRTEVEGTRQVIKAINGSQASLIYMSIVGVDRHGLAYYRAKAEAERLVSSSSAPWTILRATQFHDLVDLFLSYPLFVRTPQLAFQGVAPAEAADRIVQLLEAGQSGRVPDFGGPEVTSIDELAAVRRRVTGRRSRLVRVPRFGSLRDFDAGIHCCPDHRGGIITWEQWLSERQFQAK